MDTVFDWPPLESDPAIFTKYMQDIGNYSQIYIPWFLIFLLGLPSDWIINEAFGLDDDCLSFVPKPTVAAIVTYEKLKKEENK
jgi:hypothetical protein